MGQEVAIMNMLSNSNKDDHHEDQSDTGRERSHSFHKILHSSGAQVKFGFLNVFNCVH